MAKREKVYLKDTAIWDSIDHEASKAQFPEVYSDLENLLRYSNKYLVWKCSNCHESQAAKINSRSRGSGCYSCGVSKRAKSRGVPKKGNSLADKRPDLVLEWDFSRNNKNPDEVNYGTNFKFWWVCLVGHDPYI